jgi:hypothetical protein
LPQTLGANNALAISTIGCYRAASDLYATNMRCDYVYCWSRALPTAEMAWVYREPFGFIGRRTSLPVTGFSGGTIHNISGSVVAGSSLVAAVEVAPASDLPTGEPWPGVTLEIEASWRREVILNGMTDTAVKLGTLLTQGWFWMRRSGCSVVYRGVDVPDVTSGMIVCVAAADAGQAPVPVYLPHESNSTCCYLVRRFNSCGYPDRTTHAAASARFGPDGRIVAAPANSPLDLRAEPAAGNKVWLTWFYSPLDQATAPQVFRIYGDGGVGGIDFVHPLASLPYKGHGLYRLRSQSLDNGWHVFAVRAESAGDVDSSPQAIAGCELKACAIGEPGILNVEVI